MLWFNSSNASTESVDEKYKFVTYYPLTLIIVGTLFNFFTFAILWRPIFRDTKKRPTIHYIRTIAIFDILMLYGWNLDHYLSGAYGFMLQTYSIPFCKFCSFLNYFTAQVSAWLRVFICLDRYLSLSHRHKTWFSQSRNVLIIIIFIIIVFTIINFHFFLFACYYNENGTVNIQARHYQIYPLWDYINLGLYNCAPFIFMIVFNIGVIYHLIHLRQTSTIRKSRIQHRSISLTLVITTFLFLIMTIPATVSFGFFFSTADSFVLHLFDSILYTYHILSFPIYLITFKEFRQEVFLLIIPCK
ncbi:unnamed protein product [Rotaria sp. Silwood1]|nr:unnamed protein product [Rotaria sp. Silwood1]CAF3367299.1 unnamed protein product [Rotaria sp. Silwood1]CAF3398152.1 unnamed protein product [Rotaria sp. Silwood1]CAF4646144.1 unnamed protein product [Rotaria sp. Silwood1]CAF4971352.1 unnamed protein product [Rotaria sp. Silwood1]